MLYHVYCGAVPTLICGYHSYLMDGVLHLLGECHVLFYTIHFCLSLTRGIPLQFSTLSTSLYVAKVLFCAFLGSLTLLWALWATCHIFVSYISVITLSFLVMVHTLHPSRIVSGIPLQAGSYLWKVDCCSVTLVPKYVSILMSPSRILEIVSSCGGETVHDPFAFMLNRSQPPSFFLCKLTWGTGIFVPSIWTTILMCSVDVRNPQEVERFVWGTILLPVGIHGCSLFSCLVPVRYSAHPWLVRV